jgi:type I restriction enzyme S subunit
MMRIVPLSDVCDFLDSMRRPVTAKDRVAGVYPYYGANGILDYVDEYLFDEDLVLLAEDGGFFDDPKRGVAYRVSGKCWVNNHAHVLRPRKNIDVDYLGYVLKQYDIRPYITGATVKKLNQKAARQIKIPLPSLEEQERIVKILDQVDMLRQKREQAIKLLDDYLKSVFLEMFGDPVRNPKGWKKKKLGEITESRLGKMRDKQYITGKYLEPYLGNSNVKWFYFDLSSLLEMDFDEQEKIRYSLHDGDLLICEGGDIGRCAIWRNQLENCYFQKALHRVRTDKRIIIPEYLQWVLFFYSKGNAFKESRSQATIAHLTGIKLKRLPVPVAKIDLQNEFAKTIRKTELVKQKMVAQAEELENQFQALMQRAFKGQL